ncbi:hypothetical protein KKF34_17255 [Myxococcota bacterium]|nr:hypothetical protein [Myxococcota bacterium]MBU1381088.1 hypothetical protein [Myxococcota bacterium]MBU1498629.1 hypothetical protein [Myxococcota bacterium]
MNYRNIPVISGIHYTEKLLWPYLPLTIKEVLISYPYACRSGSTFPDVRIFLDSGSYGYLAYGGTLKRDDCDTTSVILKFGDTEFPIRATELLDYQEKHAYVAFTLDIPVRASDDDKTVTIRYEESLNNALFALSQRRKRSMKLYASISAHPSLPLMRRHIEKLRDEDFDGLAVGALLQYRRDKILMEKIIGDIMDLWDDRPVHFFGLTTIPHILTNSEITTDSSTWIKLALSGKAVGSDKIIESPSRLEIIHLALYNLCKISGRQLDAGAAMAMRTTLLKE